MERPTNTAYSDLGLCEGPTIRNNPLTLMGCIGYAIVCSGLIVLTILNGLTGIFVSSILIILGCLIIIIEILNIEDWRGYFLLLAFSSFFVFVYPFSGIMVTFSPNAIQDLLPTDPLIWKLSLQVGTAGWISLSLGFILVKIITYPSQCSRKLASQNIKWEYSWSVLLIFSFAGILCRIFLLLTFFSKEFMAFYNIAGTIPSTISNLGLMISFVLILSDKIYLRRAGFSIFIFYCLTGLFTGQRADVFIPVIMAGIFMLLYRWKVSWKLFIGIFTILGILVITYPLMTKYKLLMQVARKSSTGAERVQNIEDTISDLKDEQGVLGDNGSKDYLRNLELLCKRFSHMQYGGQLVSTYVDSHGYAYGESFLEGFMALIPRAIWSNKPTIGLGEIAYQMMGYTGPGAATIPAAADCYINFGWFGVGVCMFLIGCFYAFLNNLLLGKDFLCLALLAFLTFHLMIAGMGVSNIVAMPIINGMAIFVVRKFAIRQVQL